MYTQETEKCLRVSFNYMEMFSLAMPLIGGPFISIFKCFKENVLNSVTWALSLWVLGEKPEHFSHCCRNQGLPCPGGGIRPGLGKVGGWDEEEFCLRKKDGIEPSEGTGPAWGTFGMAWSLASYAWLGRRGQDHELLECSQACRSGLDQLTLVRRLTEHIPGPSSH